MPQSSEERKEYKRRYMRRYMRQLRKEKRRGKTSKGGDYRGGLGKGGEQDVLDFLLDISLDSVASPQGLRWVINQIRLLQGRVTLLEADKALMEALLKQADEWSS